MRECRGCIGVGLRCEEIEKLPITGKEGFKRAVYHPKGKMYTSSTIDECISGKFLPFRYNQVDLLSYFDRSLGTLAHGPGCDESEHPISKKIARALRVEEIKDRLIMLIPLALIALGLAIIVMDEDDSLALPTCVRITAAQANDSRLALDVLNNELRRKGLDIVERYVHRNLDEICDRN